MGASSPSPTLSVRLVQPFTRALLARNVDVLPLSRGLDLKPEVLGDPDARIRWDVTLELVDRSVKASGDPALGLHAAEHVHPGDFDALELVARASGTRRGALAAVSRYAGLMNDGLSLRHTVEGKNEAWTLSLPSPSSRVAMEFSLAVLVLVGRTLSDGEENPDAVDFAFPPPADPAEYERVLRCPVRWGGTRNALVVATERLDRKIARITPSLTLAMEQHAAKLLAALPKVAAQSTRVREHILDALRQGPASPAEVCRRLKISKRTLRRRLQEEGATFSELLSDVRREMAHQHLEDPSRSVSEVAFLLGFADTSAFQRAFRRWYGVPPSEYRRGVGA